MTLSGLDVGTIRAAAASPDFLPAILDYVVSDEALLIDIAREIGSDPEAIVSARHRLSPEPDWEP